MRLRSLSSFEAAALCVDTKGPQASSVLSPSQSAGLQGSSQVGDVKAPAVEVSEIFPYQSYFDDTLLQNGITVQPQNQPIIPDTLTGPIQLSGYAIGLHPSSEAPVAITFSAGGQQGQSVAYRLKPGQVMRPYGHTGAFSGFSFGLPFGWLGGGSVMLVVFRTPDAKVDWSQQSPEIVYHRTRLKIYDPALMPDPTDPSTFPFNWPSRFPWSKAVGPTTVPLDPSALQPQGGSAALALSPTRTSLRLNAHTVGGTLQMHAYMIGADVWCQSSVTFGVDDLAGNQARVDFQFNPWTQQATAVSPYSLSTQTLWFKADNDITRVACNDGALILSCDDPTFYGSTVDAVRYGRL